ncbi:hypothetical protein B0H14DRAFT_3496316 [Mycena olivaceomarginata]|nr:hypothetical protein B0H14DRAFT_3496316 [Mycena olivaceomarginata]
MLLLYTSSSKLVAEASTGSTLSPNEEISAAPLTAPFPASPSHPAAPAILSTLKATQKGYADMRGIWSRKCLETQGKRFIDRADTVDSIVAGKDFGRWLELLLSVADEEYGCIKDLSPLNIPNVVASPYNALLNPILFLFSTTLTSVIALIKRSPPALGHPSPQIRETSMRASGRRALLPEFLADFEMALLVKNVPGTETSVGVVERCQVHGPPAGGARRGGSGLVVRESEDGRRMTVGKNSKLDDGDEQLILERRDDGDQQPNGQLAHGSMYLRNNIVLAPPRAEGHTLATKFDTVSLTTSSPIAICASTSPSSSLILHRPSPAARVVHNGLQQQREARVEVRCGPALAEAAAAAQRVLHALREEVVVVVLLLSAVLETSSLYRTSEIYQAIEPSDGVGR